MRLLFAVSCHKKLYSLHETIFWVLKSRWTMICCKIVLLFTLSKFLYIYPTIVGSRLIFSSNPNISYLACVDSLLWFSGLCPEIKQKGSPYWRCRGNFFKNKNSFSSLFSHTSKLLFRLFTSCWFFFLWNVFICKAAGLEFSRRIVSERVSHLFPRPIRQNKGLWYYVFCT